MVHTISSERCSVITIVCFTARRGRQDDDDDEIWKQIEQLKKDVQRVSHNQQDVSFRAVRVLNSYIKVYNVHL